jgi:hypothetical protein
MRSPIVVTLAALALSAVSAVVAGWVWQHAAGGKGSDVAAGAGIGHPIYELDPRDDRALADYATDIFIGRVLDQTGAVGAPTSAPGQELPQSQFAVQILHVIKGQAGGVVTVNQVGGLDKQSEELMLFEGDAPLRPGASELFLVVSVPERGWYQIVAAGYGHEPADNPAQRQTLIDRFDQATVPLTSSESSNARPPEAKT